MWYVLPGNCYLKWNDHDPGREKFHHYKLHPKHSAGYSDEWLGIVQAANEIDYSKVPIIDPDPREKYGKVEENLKAPESDGAEGLRRSSKPLPFEKRKGDNKGLKILIVTIDTRPLLHSIRNVDTDSIDNTAMINSHYAKLNGYDYLYVATTETGHINKNGTVCNILRSRFNITSLLSLQCPKGAYKGKYDVATYHISRKSGRASSWNKLPPLIYLADQYGSEYDYFLYIDSDVLLNSKYADVSISDKLEQWNTQKSNIGPIEKFPIWGEQDVYKSHMLALSNYPWRDDYPCAGVFLIKPDRVGIEMLLEWWDYHIPLKNLFDFMEQDALWYLKDHGSKGPDNNYFKINNRTMTMIYESQFASNTHGVGDLFFVHMANYVEQKGSYVNVMIKELKSKKGKRLDIIKVVKKYQYLELNTIGLCEYAEQTRKRYNISLRQESYYPGLHVGKDDDIWHDRSMSGIIPFKDREKYDPPMGRLYNGYAMGFKDFRALFYVYDDLMHEFPNWETFVGMGFDLDHTLQFRDFGRRKPCKEKGIPPGWPILDINLQKKGLGLYDVNATSNGSLVQLH